MAAFEMIQCPHCHTQVVLAADGNCPACRKNTREEPAPVGAMEAAKDRSPTPGEAWDRYQASLRPSHVESSITFLRQLESPFIDLWTAAVAHVRSNAGPDSAAANRIRQELLPQYVTAIEELDQIDAGQNDDDKSQLIEYAKTREESWEILAEALSENAPEKLERHLELREKSELLGLSIIGEKESTGTPNPAKHVEDFQRALQAFTPRMIATPALVLANIIVFAVMIFAGVDLFQPTVQSVMDWGANFGALTENGQWWRLVTCMFLHYGVLHLGFNMWILLDLGRVVERLVGNVGFVVLYFVSGIAGSIASLAWNPFVVSAGASGAVFGVAGALLGLIAFRQDSIPAPVLKHLRNSLLALLLYNFVYGMMAPGIDMAAHIGGFMAGFVCGLILSQPLSVAMVARRRFRNATVAIVGAIALLFGTLALPDPLPLCTSVKVRELLEQVIRGAPVGATLKSIDGQRELSYDRDAHVRHGECMVHTSTGDIAVKFAVDWQDRNKGVFRVQTLATDLPSCTSVEVTNLLEQVIRKTLVGATLESVDGHRELDYDRAANVRHGECVAHTSIGEIPVRFVVEWKDPKAGRFQVRIVVTQE